MQLITQFHATHGKEYFRPQYFFNVILRLVLDDGTRGYPSSPLLFLLSLFPPVIKTLFVQSVRTK